MEPARLAATAGARAPVGGCLGRERPAGTARGGSVSALRKIPSAGWWCAAIALLNVAVWTFVTPPFHVPDETVHVAYVQYFAEHAEPPNDPDAPVFASQEAGLLDALGFPLVVGRGET